MQITELDVSSSYDIIEERGHQVCSYFEGLIYHIIEICQGTQLHLVSSKLEGCCDT